MLADIGYRLFVTALGAVIVIAFILSVWGWRRDEDDDDTEDR